MFSFHWQGIETPRLVGTLIFLEARGGEICSFSYDSTWLSSYFLKYTLDPELQLFEGREYHYVSLKVILDYF